MKKVVPALLACLALAAPANAESYDFELPQRWNEDLAPGTHCATPGRTDTYVEATRRWFKQTDAASVSNDTEAPVPVEQTVKEKRVQTLEVSGTFTPKGDLVKNVSRAYGWKYVHEVYWSLNQVVGPYMLDSGKQGRLVWGFTMLDGDAQDVKCSPDQVWQPIGQPYYFSVPEARYSELRVESTQL
ncbi:hypothetical protein ACUXOC_001531 [Corynebacterium mucifaciens]